MKRSEFNHKVRLLTKRILSSKTLSIRLTNPDKKILLYSFYFALRYEDEIKRIKQVQNKISDAEACFADKGKPDYDHKKALRDASKIMGWSKKKTGKQPRFSPKKERAIIDHFRAIRTFFPEVTRAKALEQIYEEDDSLKKIQPENREKSIQRLSKAYPRELSEEEANAIAPDPDRFFEDLDIMIHELIKGDS